MNYGTNSGESANHTFSDVGMSFLDDTVSRTNEKNGKHQVLREGSQNCRDVSATSSTKMYNFAQHIRHRQRDMEGFKSRGRKIMHDEEITHKTHPTALKHRVTYHTLST